MARTTIATACILLLALAMLATSAAAVDHLKASTGAVGRRLRSSTSLAAVEASLAGRRKLSAATATQETCDWIYGNEYCGRGTQFNCCKGETNSKWTGCEVADNNYKCPSYAPKAVCCWP